MLLFLCDHKLLCLLLARLHLDNSVEVLVVLSSFKIFSDFSIEIAQLDLLKVGEADLFHLLHPLFAEVQC